MSNRIWVFGAVLVSIVIIVLGWFLGISPKLAEADVASSERANVDAQNVAQEAAIGLLKEQFADLDKVKAELKKLQESIPNSTSADTFIDSVAAAAVSNGVILDSVTPLEGAAYGGSVDPTAAADPTAVQPADPSVTVPNTASTTLDASLTGRFYTVGVSIEVLGGADQMYAFADTLQKNNRLFLVTDVTFSTDGEPGGKITGFFFVVTDTAAAATPQ
jgi:Tfp pilus assembly protein PilO